MLVLLMGLEPIRDFSHQHLKLACLPIRFAWLTSLVLRDCNPLIPVLALGRVTIKTEKMVRGCDLMQIRLGAEGGT